MPEYIVECDNLRYVDEHGLQRVIVVPYGTAHVRERIVRCCQCAYGHRHGDDAPIPGYCRRHGRALWDFDGYCSDGEVRHGNAKAAGERDRAAGSE